MINKIDNKVNYWKATRGPNRLSVLVTYDKCIYINVYIEHKKVTKIKYKNLSVYKTV